MTSKYWLIVGLGNPGKQYEGTRHNMGFLCLDELASRWSVSFHDHKGLALLGSGVMRLDSRMEKAFFVKPLTFMNNSGDAVSSICEYYGIEPIHVIVCHDDMDLEFGRIKVKAGGSAGGHNGIRSMTLRWEPTSTPACASAPAIRSAANTRTRTPSTGSWEDSRRPSARNCQRSSLERPAQPNPSCSVVWKPPRESTTPSDGAGCEARQRPS